MDTQAKRRAALWMAALAALFIVILVQQIWTAGDDRGSFLIALVCGFLAGVAFAWAVWARRRPQDPRRELSPRHNVIIALGAGVGGTLLGIGPDWGPIALGGFCLPSIAGLAAVMWRPSLEEP